MKKIITPTSSDEVKDLHAGDFVTISGTILTARDQAHKRIVEEGPPCNLQGAAIFHAGPIIIENEKNNSNNNEKSQLDYQNKHDKSNKPTFKMLAIGPTTSMRMNPYESDIIDLGAKIIIGKGGMDESVAKSLQDQEAVYMVAVGGCAALYADSIKEIMDVDWIDLGMPEAIWKLKVDSFGPLIVAMDSHGNNLFK